MGMACAKCIQKRAFNRVWPPGDDSQEEEEEDEEDDSETTPVSYSGGTDFASRHETTIVG